MTEFFRVMRPASAIQIAAAAAVLVCAGCANFKSGDAPLADEPAPAVAESPSPTKPDDQTPQTEKPAQPPFGDDGLRLPDMLSLPSESELRRPPPDVSNDGTAGVTPRPPAEQPPRTRPDGE